MRRFGRAAASAVAALLFWGCTPSLKNVRVFADGLVATRELPDPIAADVFESCLRGERYGLLRNQLLSLQNAAQLYEQGARVCQASAHFGADYAAFHALIVAYGKALQELSADEAVDYDALMQELAASADSGVTLVSGQTIDQLVRPGVTQASTKLSAVVAKWAAEGYRRAEVRRAIREGAPHVSVILEGLVRMIAELYLPGLDVEEDRARSLFKVLAKVETSQAALADLNWRRVQLELAARRQSARELLERLTALNVANRKLLALAERSGAGVEGEELLAELKPLLKDLVGVAGEFRAVAWDPPPALPIAASGPGVGDPSPAGAAPSASATVPLTTPPPGATPVNGAAPTSGAPNPRHENRPQPIR